MVEKLAWLDSVCHHFDHQGTSMFVVQIVFFCLYFETTMKACENIKTKNDEKKNTNASMTKMQYSMHKPHL